MKARNFFRLASLFTFSFLYYLAVAFYLRWTGYYHHESLFFTEKVLVLSDSVHPKFNLIGFSYPTLQFLVCSLLFWVKPIMIPVVASALGVSYLLTLVVKYEMDFKLPGRLIAATILFFLLNPVIVYAASTGTSMYLTFLLFFVFFFSLFYYIEEVTTYRLVIAALCMPLVLFVNFRLLWLILFLLPFIVMISLHSLGLRNKSLYQQIEMALNNPSLRRKFIGKSYSILIILLFLPVAAIFFFLMVNSIYTTNPFFFLENPNSSWNSLDIIRFFEFGSDRMYNFFSVDTLFVLWRSLQFCPLFFIMLFLFSGNVYRLLLGGSALALLMFLHNYYGFFTITSEYLVLYIAFALAALIFYTRYALITKIRANFMIVFLLGSCVSAYFYMKFSSYKQEKSFIQALHGVVTETEIAESRKVAAYIIQHISSDKHILIDDAVLYPVVAFSGRTDFLILHYHPNFLAILQKAHKFSDYIILPNENKDVGRLDIINQYHKGMYSYGRDYLRLVFQTPNFKVYKVLHTEE